MKTVAKRDIVPTKKEVKMDIDNSNRNNKPEVTNIIVTSEKIEKLMKKYQYAGCFDDMYGNFYNEIVHNKYDYEHFIIDMRTEKVIFQFKTYTGDLVNDIFKHSKMQIFMSKIDGKYTVYDMKRKRAVRMNILDDLDFAGGEYVEEERVVKFYGIKDLQDGMLDNFETVTFIYNPEC